MGNEMLYRIVLEENVTGKLGEMKEVFEADKFGKAASGLGKTLTSGFTKPMITSFIAANSLADTIKKVNTTFGANNDVVNWADTTLDSYGIAKQSAMDMAVAFGDIALGMGFSNNEAANMSKEMVGLVGNMASYKKISVEAANDILKKAFAGNTEGLKNLGVVLSDAELNQSALTKGTSKGYKELSEAQKAQIRYNELISKTTVMNNAFTTSNEDVSTQQRILTEQVKEVSAEFGNSLLPVGSKVLALSIDLLKGFNGLSQGAKNFIVYGAGFIGGLGGILNMAGKVSSTLTTLKEVKAGLTFASKKLFGESGLLKNSFNGLNSSGRRQLNTLKVLDKGENALVKTYKRTRDSIIRKISDNKNLNKTSLQVSKSTSILSGGFNKLKNTIGNSAKTTGNFIKRNFDAIKSNNLFSSSARKTSTSLNATGKASNIASKAFGYLGKGFGAVSKVLFANPFGVIAIAIIGVITGLTILYNKSAKFRNIIDSIGKAVMNVLKKIPFLSSFMGKGNSTSPKFKIPFLAQGTDNWHGGLAITQERGGEIMDLPRGTRVYPHDKTVRMARMEGQRSASKNININKLADKIEVRNHGDIDTIVEKLAFRLEKIINNGGGEVFA